MVKKEGTLRRSVGASSLLGVTVLCFFGGCAKSGAGDVSPGSNAGADASYAAADASHVGAGADATLGDPPVTVSDAAAGACSADLRSILDNAGHIVQTCADDQGCANGACVAACDAAGADHGTLGCDFWVSTPSFDQYVLPPCFVVFLTNGWVSTAAIAVSRGRTSYDPTLFARVPSAGAPASSWPALPATGLLPNQVAVLFLSGDPASTSQEGTSLGCPVASAIAAETAVWGVTGANLLDGGVKMGPVTGRGTAWHITSSVPLNGYDVVPFGGAPSYLPSAELLLPTSGWGTNYVAALPPVGLVMEVWGQILASEDDTHVSIVPTIDLPSGSGVDAAPRNALTSLSLNAGEYVQWQWLNTGGDMSGTVISSDKPVLFVGGNGHLCLQSSTSTGGGCDSEHEPVPPVSALGHEYVAMPYATRRADLQPESIPYRIVGTVDGTVLTVDPPGTAVPGSIALGQVADFEATGAFVVSSQDGQHAFWIAQQMTGCYVTGGSRDGVGLDASYGDCLGDEDDVGMIPPDQWLSRYVFFTDPTYATTNLVLARARTETGFHDVTIDCVGTVTGWQPIGTGGQYEVTDVDLVRGGSSVRGCQNGPHVATSDGPFAVVVWGLDSYASYSYPAGGNFTQINSVVVPAAPR